ncbi:ABC transporter substrate-binding protein [Sulfurimonas crateris]|uniref:ABC transporter substrate-binding protein n=1 Tax=Sulfurimonas crateris TaxID=2574727 RepID=A0A4U2Z568_9BACT|nr:ABC transporter substrate-binding protein [Sulfurimonas crateris]TKI69318.1 ABC transporter substrate-binding protein [Sulfurimonas crateris]
MLKKTLTLLLLVLSFTLHSKVINENPKKVFGSSPPMNYLIYAINPSKMVGLNFYANNINNNADVKFLKQSFLELPVIGSFPGSGQGINLETIIKHNPDLILIWEDVYFYKRVEEQIRKAQIPSITIPFRKIESMPSSILTAAKAMNEHKRGKILSDYTKERIEYIKNMLQELEPVKYYYAEGADGLATECSDSMHVEALNFAGGENVHKCTQSNLKGLERISFETLVGYDPQVIIAQNRLVYNTILSNPLWKHLQAVKNKRVYVVPSTPFNWIDRPPSFMRIIGIEWLAHNFHPTHYKNDIYTQIAKFYKLFLDVELTQEQIYQIIGEKE